MIERLVAWEVFQAEDFPTLPAGVLRLKRRQSGDREVHTAQVVNKPRT